MVIFQNHVEVAPYWNVNLGASVSLYTLTLVEVAPYWNVNVTCDPSIPFLVSVEVAPYWNVNALMKLWDFQCFV